MNIPFALFATTVGTVIIGVSTWFATAQAALSGRVDTLSTEQAATAQYVKDTDSRLTRIETKLDAVISKTTK